MGKWESANDGFLVSIPLPFFSYYVRTSIRLKLGMTKQMMMMMMTVTVKVII